MALFNVQTDPTELENVADEYPEKVRELADAWEAAAWANTVFPLSDASGLGGLRRPEEAELEQPLRLFRGRPRSSGYGPGS